MPGAPEEQQQGGTAAEEKDSGTATPDEQGEFGEVQRKPNPNWWESTGPYFTRDGGPW